MIDIGGHRVGSGQRCLIVAEAGVNHGGSVAASCELVRAAAGAGADAVKFQAFQTERLAAASAPKAPYQQRTTGAAESQLEMLERLAFTAAAHREAAAVAREAGLMFLSSVFDEPSADMVEALGVPAFKIPSGELPNLAFLSYVARKGRPLIVSTGMATLGEVDRAVQAVIAAGVRGLVLMHCVSRYPADPADVNLRAMATMAAVFNRPCGYSDHTPGHDVAVAAVALGACVLEKHLTLDRAAPGPDHAASLEPDDFARLVHAVRTAEAALGDGRKRPVAGEAEIARTIRRSLVAATTIPAGAVLTEEAIALLRPGSGLPPEMKAAVIGRTAGVDIPAGTVLSLDLLA